MGTSAKDMAALKRYVPALYKLRRTGETEKTEDEYYMDLSDPEWFMERDVYYTMIHDAFAGGVLAAHPVRRGVRAAFPQNFEMVCNQILERVEAEFKVTDNEATHVVQVTLRRLEALFRKWTKDIPEFAAWSESGAINAVAAIHNAIQWLNNEMIEQVHFCNKVLSESESEAEKD